MLSLNPRSDYFRLLLPKDFICEEIVEKYTKILRDKHGFYVNPIDYLNETILSIDVFGFVNASYQQNQPSTGYPLINPSRIRENEFQYPAAEYTYRSEVSPLSIIDKTLNINFRHTLGYLNYFLMFENFFYQYSRDRSYNELASQFIIDILNEKGSIYSRIVIDSPIINGMDMISFDYTQPVASNTSFKVEFKYSNFDFQFLNIEKQCE